jgi:hypothetical protein
MAIQRRRRRIVAAVVLVCIAGYFASSWLSALTPRPMGWDLRPPLADAGPVTAEAMMPGIYPVGSRQRGFFAPGGFGPCSNYSIDIANESWGKGGELSLVAFPDEAVS